MYCRYQATITAKTFPYVWGKKKKSEKSKKTRRNKTIMRQKLALVPETVRRMGKVAGGVLTPTKWRGVSTPGSYLAISAGNL